MFKKRIMFFILLMLSFGILTSCSEEYIKYNLPNDNNYYNPWRNGSYHNPLLLGTKVKYEYNETHNVEIYYGMNRRPNEGFFFDDNPGIRSDYDQMVEFNIIRKCYIGKDIYNMKYVDEEKVYSINVKLGDFLEKDEYIFDINNKIVDEINVTYFNDYSNEDKIYITYSSEIRTLNDEYIKYIMLKEYYDDDAYYDESINEYVPLKSYWYNPFSPSLDYHDVKSIDSDDDITFEIILRDGKFKVAGSGYKVISE